MWEGVQAAWGLVDEGFFHEYSRPLPLLSRVGEGKWNGGGVDAASVAFLLHYFLGWSLF